MEGCVFHQDIILCILTRLPVKSIIRLKSVCKPWRDLFSSPEFIKMHHGQFSSNSRNQCLIMESKVFIDSRADDERALDSGRVFSLLEIESDEERAVHRSPETENMNIVGCCNGLICMGNPLEQESIVFWNPAINLFKFVSISEIVGFTDPYHLSIGFGYDAEGDDFKAVIISCFQEENKGTGVEVYSVNSESWITIEPGFKIKGCSPENVAIVNGNPYWTAIVGENQSAKSRHVGDVFVCFNVRKMEFKVVPAPASSPIFHIWNLSGSGVYMDWKGALVDWKGSLGALVCTKDNNEKVESLDVLVYDDGEQVWRKEHTFGPNEEVSLGQILDISKKGKILGRCLTGELIGFDPETGWVKVYEVHPSSYWNYLYLYTESLTYIKGMRPSACDRTRERGIGV